MNKKVLWIILLVGVLGVCVVVLLDRSFEPDEIRYEATDGDGLRALHSDGGSFLIRFISINAPGKSQTLGETAFELNERLIRDAQEANLLLVTPKPSDASDYAEDRYGRPLVRVFLNGEEDPEQSVEMCLVSKGLARLDVQDPNDLRIQEGEDFAVRYADSVIAAQIEAAMTRQGWWGEVDGYAASDVIIAVIKQWSADEIVYILNRGNESVDLGEGWKLTDNNGHELVFSDFPGCILPPKGILRVHSYSAANERTREMLFQTKLVIDLYWTAKPIWNQDGDIASLYAPGGALSHSYSYPLTDTYWK